MRKVGGANVHSFHSGMAEPAHQCPLCIEGPYGCFRMICKCAGSGIEVAGIPESSNYGMGELDLGESYCLTMVPALG